MDKLLQEISIEKEYILQTLDALNDVLKRNKKTIIELSAIGSFLHHSYNGIENIIKRILKYKRVNIVDSSSSHKDLLNMAIKNKILSSTLVD